MTTSRTALAAVLMLLTTPYAHADWIVLGAAQKCQPGESFEIQAIIETSSPNDGSTVQAKPGFKELATDQTTSIQCKVGAGTLVKSKIRVTSPRATGMCAGSGDVSIDLLTVNGKAVLVPGEPFNMACLSGPAVVSVRIQRTNTGVVVEICRGEWEWGAGYEKQQCRSTQAPNPSIERTSPGKPGAASHVKRWASREA